MLRAKDNILPGDTIVQAVNGLDDWYGGHVSGQTLPPPTDADTPNAEITHEPCPCGRTRHRIKAIKAIGKGQVITVKRRLRRGPQLLLQGDGGASRNALGGPIAGAGVAIWILQPGRADILLAKVAVPAPGHGTSMEAEGVAAAAILRMVPFALELTRASGYTVAGKILAHLDSNSWAQFLRGKRRIKTARLYTIYEKGLGPAGFASIGIQWQHRPREHNWEADSAATAMKHLEETRRLHGDDRPWEDAQLMHEHELAEQAQAACMDAEEADLPQVRNYPRAGLPPHTVTSLQEVPTLDAGVPQIVEAIQDPYRRRLGRALLRAAMTAMKGKGSIPTTYQALHSNGQGRRYPRSPTGANGDKALALLLYGRSHVEYDIQGCHPALLLATLPELTSDYPHMRTQEGYRQQLEQWTGLTGAGSDIARRTVSATPAQVLRYVAAQSGNAQGQLAAFLGQLQAMKPLALLRLHAQGHVGPTDRILPRNALYFALEALEAHIMREWLARLLTHPAYTSILWRGDALWIHQGMPSTAVYAAFQAAAGGAGIGDIVLRSAHLLQELHNRFPVLTGPQRQPVARARQQKRHREIQAEEGDERLLPPRDTGRTRQRAGYLQV